MKAGVRNWYFIVARPTCHNNVEQPQKHVDVEFIYEAVEVYLQVFHLISLQHSHIQVDSNNLPMQHTCI